MPKPSRKSAKTTTIDPDDERFSYEPFEELRWHVKDAKYDEAYLVDLGADTGFEHGACSCKEFRFQVHIKRRRTTCSHITFLIKKLAAFKPIADPRFRP